MIRLSTKKFGAVMTAAWKISPIKLGVEVFGADLTQIDKDSKDVEEIKQLVTDQRVVVFRNQPMISGEKQVEISKWFGQLDSDAYYKHPRSPSYDVFRVSNDGNEGCRGVGRTGWHIDGTFRKKPYAISVYYMHSVPKDGDTRFVGLRDVLESIPSEQLKKWERLWMVSDRRAAILHPLVYTHPESKLKTMCFHLGMTEGYTRDYGSKSEEALSVKESLAVHQEIEDAILANDQALVYSHKWTTGDLVITDNLAVGHEASPDSQRPVSEVGLRILHRVTVAGKHEPRK